MKIVLEYHFKWVICTSDRINSTVSMGRPLLSASKEGAKQRNVYFYLYPLTDTIHSFFQLVLAVQNGATVVTETYLGNASSAPVGRNVAGKM